MLPASSEVAERIEKVYPDLSEALRRFADFVLTQPVKVVQLSINETVHASGVSVATANRFARRLGYDSYPKFRAEVFRSFEDVVAPVERLREQISTGAGVERVIAESFAEDIENLNTTLANLDMARVEAVVERIVAARRIFALGFDQAGSLMQLFAHQLQIMGVDVRTATTGGRLAAAREMSQLGAEDIVLAVAFPRYIRDTVELAEEAAARDLSVVAITDSQVSPLARIAEMSIYLHSRRTIGSTSDTAILCFLEALAAAVASRRPGADCAAQNFAEFALPWVVSQQTPRR